MGRAFFFAPDEVVPEGISPRVALSAGEEQPVGSLLVYHAVVVGDRLDADVLEDRAKCIGKR